MSRKKTTKVKLYLTERALADLVSIESNSIEQWGKRVATRYFSDIEGRLSLVQENPAILVPAEGLPETLKCYPVREHVLVFDVQLTSLVLLTVIHGSRDIPNRLGELVPTLAAEVELLHGKLRSGKKT